MCLHHYCSYSRCKTSKHKKVHTYLVLKFAYYLIEGEADILKSKKIFLNLKKWILGKILISGKIVHINYFPVASLIFATTFKLNHATASED